MPSNPSVQASEWYSYLRNDVLESNNRICKQKKNATSLFLVPNECAIGTHPQRKVTFFLFPITFKFSVELLYSYKERYKSSYFLAELPQEKSAAIALSTIRFHASLSP